MSCEVVNMGARCFGVSVVVCGTVPFVGVFVGLRTDLKKKKSLLLSYPTLTPPLVLSFPRGR